MVLFTLGCNSATLNENWLKCGALAISLQNEANGSKAVIIKKTTNESKADTRKF